jgi:hypothetical protein
MGPGAAGLDGGGGINLIYSGAKVEGALPG